MSTNEVKERICQEYIAKYHEWLTDYAEMPDLEYGMKYGWQKNPELIVKDSIKAITYFQKYIFSGRWLPAWEREGYDRRSIWDLNREGFLSYQEYGNWTARATGRTDFYFISQKTARQIWRDHH